MNQWRYSNIQDRYISQYHLGPEDFITRFNLTGKVENIVVVIDVIIIHFLVVSFLRYLIVNLAEYHSAFIPLLK